MLKLFSTPEREIRQTMFERDKYIIWEAGEVIYRAGDPSNDGFYDHGRVRPDFHERGAAAEPHRHERDSGRDVASSQCHPIRTVTAIAASTGAKATRIPMQYFEDIAARDRVTCALIRKNQYRLIDSNTQSNMLGTEIKRLSVLVEHAINNGFSDNTAIDELRTTIARLRKQVVFDTHHAYHPSTMEGSHDNGENADNFG
jgi:hypothetical protein